MGFIEKMNKYGTQVAVKKTKLFADMAQHEAMLKDCKVEFKIRRVLDLLSCEVLVNGLLNQWRIDCAYDAFCNEYYDTFNHITYDEKRRMFNSDLKPLLEELPHFKDKGRWIYLPHYEGFINDWYTLDYGILSLKQHMQYVKNQPVTMDMPAKLYGMRVFDTDFSSLVKVFEDDRHLDFWHEEFQSVFIFMKDSGRLINTVILGGYKGKRTPSVEDVVKITECLEAYDYHGVLDEMLNRDLMSEKIYRKLIKKAVKA